MNSVKHEAGRYFRNKYREYLKLKVEDREKKKQVQSTTVLLEM